MTYVAVENATGDLYIVHVDKLDPYRVLARDVLKLANADDPNFDTGNVDFDLYELPLPPVGDRSEKLRQAGRVL